ncbi:MAG: hypothetical protein ABS939_00535 [Psychrobacillus sp.]|nr:hypothetical protein [uncultured Psychrobacillus sp.]
MKKQEPPTIKDIVVKNRKKRETERKKSKERTAAFRKKLKEY